MAKTTKLNNQNIGGTSLVRRNIIALAFSTALVLGPVNLDWAAASAVIGTSAAVQGQVFVSTNGAQRKAEIKESIQLNDAVTTKKDSALQILLLDRSTFTVGQNCNMIIDKFVYDPSSDAGEVSATVTKGAFRFMSGNIGKKNPTNASVSTPSATIGIRGTIFEGVVGEDAIALAQLGGLSTSSANSGRAGLIILRGPGAKSNALDRPGVITVSTAGGSSSLFSANYAVFDPGNGNKPSRPFKVTQDMQDYMDFFLRTKPNGSSDNPSPLDENVGRESGQDKFELPIDIVEDQDKPNIEIEDLVDGIQDILIDRDCDDFYGSAFAGAPSGCYGAY